MPAPSGPQVCIPLIAAALPRSSRSLTAWLFTHRLLAGRAVAWIVQVVPGSRQSDELSLLWCAALCSVSSCARSVPPAPSPDTCFFAHPRVTTALQCRCKNITSQLEADLHQAADGNASAHAGDSCIQYACAHSNPARQPRAPRSSFDSKCPKGSPRSRDLTAAPLPAHRPLVQRGAGNASAHAGDSGIPERQCSTDSINCARSCVEIGSLSSLQLSHPWIHIA